jgi:hypothetical protein
MLKATSIIGSLLVLVALVITFLKAAISFVAFLALAIKVIILILFVALFAGVGLMVYRTWNDRKRQA